jgi:hypothetical protein
MGLGSGIRKNIFQIKEPEVKKAPDPNLSDSVAIRYVYLGSWILIFSLPGCRIQ